MSVEELVAEALELTPQARAKPAGKLLDSLDGLSDEENQELWAVEAQRRDAAMDASPGDARPAADVFRDARSKLEQVGRASFHPLAERELIEAAQHDEQESTGLGGRFLDAAERCEMEVMEYTEAGTLIRGEVRRRRLRIFPSRTSLSSDTDRSSNPRCDEPQTQADILGGPKMKWRSNQNLQLTDQGSCLRKNRARS